MYAELYQDSVDIEIRIKSLMITKLCDPDFCIYTGTVNEPGKLGKTTLRSSGFHIHIGYEQCNIDTSLAMLQYIDAFVGIPSIIYDTDAERRKLYGKAGCFRLCEYGQIKN